MQDLGGIYTWDEILDWPDPTWLIEDIFIEKELGIIFGPPEAGKSLLAFDWACCIASGLPWYGRSVKAGPVLYIYGEGKSGIKKRGKAWMKKHGRAFPEDVYIKPRSPDLMKAKDSRDLIQAVEEVLPTAPALIVIDTVSRAMPEGDDTKGQDVKPLLTHCDDIRFHFDCAVLLVHHTGYEESHERGSSLFRGDCQIRMHMKRAQDAELSFLHCKKMKDEDHFPVIKMKYEKHGDSGVMVIAE